MSKIGKKYTLSSEQTLQITSINSALNTGSVGIAEFQEQYVNSSSRYEGKIVFTGSAITLQGLASNTALRQLISGIKTSVNFDADMHYEELIELKQLSSSMADNLDLFRFKSPFEYNFLVKNYENYLDAASTVTETALPYFYDVLTEFINAENNKGFVGTTFFETPRALISSSFRNELITNVVPYEVIVEKGPLRIDKYLEKFNVYKEQFPFYTDIKFDTHELGKRSISEVIQKKSLFTEMFETIVNQASSSTLLYSDSVTNKNIANKINIKELNVEQFLTSKLDSFVNNDFSIIFELNQRIDSKARTFLEILEDKEEYAEVIGYHLKKYQGGSTALIQEWFLPNVGEGVMSWVDTQIKYDKKYTYKLDLVVLTFATQYEITKFDLQNNKLTLEFNNKPMIKAYILGDKTTSNTGLGAVYTNKLLDYPPLEPEVELIPYVGVSNKIKINFNTSIGLKTVPAINFSPSEETRKDELRLAQNKSPDSALLTFQADEPADSIEIYRTETKPKSYEDFFGRLINITSTKNSSGASYIDTISENKKYYYVARAIDFHQNISNPTPVYELEIINDNGLILPYISIVEFDKEENKKQHSKEFKRYLKIQPAVRHRLTNNEKTNENNIQLGSDDVVPWNKRFKIRLTSKSTGKKIDVNFTFKYNKPT